MRDERRDGSVRGGGGGDVSAESSEEKKEKNVLLSRVLPPTSLAVAGTSGV